MSVQLARAPQGRCPHCQAELAAGLSDAAKVCLALIAAFAVALLALTRIWARTMGDVLEMFTGVLPWLTRLALHPAWPFGWLAVLAGLVAASLFATTRARTRATLLAIALFLAILACVATWFAISLPLHDLAGDIRAE